jgi:predicted DCC family thiol-disulfide oxidoreductase YuxK
MKRTWEPRTAHDVPDGLILFDGVCILCSWWVRFVIKRDPTARFRFSPIQSPFGQALANRLAIDIEIPETNALIDGGLAYFKSDAAIQIITKLPRWRWASVLIVIPRSLRDWIYDRVARNRYRLFGKTDACLMPTPEIASRFIFDASPKN